MLSASGETKRMDRFKRPDLEALQEPVLIQFEHCLRSRSRAASALRMSRREMLGERQVAAPLMAQRTANGAVELAHCRFQPGEGVGIQLAGLRLSGKPQWPSQCQFGHETLVFALALFAPAASRPGQHGAVQRQRGRQVAPSGHASTVGQRFLRLLPPEQEERLLWERVEPGACRQRRRDFRVETSRFYHGGYRGRGTVSGGRRVGGGQRRGGANCRSPGWPVSRASSCADHVQWRNPAVARA